MNLVEYVWDSPVNRSDPLGLQALPVYPGAPGYRKPRPKRNLNLIPELDVVIYDDLHPGSILNGNGWILGMEASMLVNQFGFHMKCAMGGSEKPMDCLEVARDQCIRRLVIVDHGYGDPFEGLQCVGDRQLIDEDVKALCNVMCDGAVVYLKGCDAAHHPSDPGYPENSAEKLLRLCPKIETVYACDGLVGPYGGCMGCIVKFSRGGETRLPGKDWPGIFPVGR